MPEHLGELWPSILDPERRWPGNSLLRNIRPPEIDCDLRETQSEFIFEANVPGVKKEEIKLELKENNHLFLSVSRTAKREEKDDQHRYYYVERSSGSVSRSIKLPTAVDATRIQANVENGVLTVHLPKVNEKENVHRIAIGEVV